MEDAPVWQEFLDETAERLLADARFVERYDPEALIGFGGSAVVYRAVQRSTRRRVAVKVAIGRWTPDLAERFVREARTLSSFRHPGLLRVFDFGVASGLPYMAMELAPGGSLRARLEQGRMSLAEIRDVLVPCLEALHACHRAGIVHRDLKPENILFGDGGRACIADFGLATMLAPEMRLTVDGGFVGTAQYASPELITGEPLTTAVDVYAIGVMLYEMLAGHPPFRAGKLQELLVQHVLEVPPPLPDGCAPVEVARLVTACLSKAPAQRPPSALAVARALEEAVLREGQVSLTAPTLLLSAPPPRRAPVLAMCLLTLASLIGVTGLGLARARLSPATLAGAGMAGGWTLEVPAPRVGERDLARLADAVRVSEDEHAGAFRRFEKMVYAAWPFDSDVNATRGLGHELAGHHGELLASLLARLEPLQRAHANPSHADDATLALWSRALSHSVFNWWLSRAAREHVAALDQRAGREPLRAPRDDEVRGVQLLATCLDAHAALAQRLTTAPEDLRALATACEDLRLAGRCIAAAGFSPWARDRARALETRFLGRVSHAALAGAWTWGRHGATGPRACLEECASQLEALARAPAAPAALAGLAERLRRDLAKRR